MAPRASKQASSDTQTNTRRSSRLNSRKDDSSSSTGGRSKRGIGGEITHSKRRNLYAQANASESSTHCNPDLSISECSAPRRSQRITSSELVKREQALIKREQTYKKKIQDLEVDISSLSSRLEEANLQLSRIRQSEAEAALRQLEEHFTCPLCYEIMAHPYSLNPGQCGHTFCALCILKWFFSRLHRQCGGWHESVDCPICRSLLVITPDRTPRLDVTFPFVPNRTAAAICQSLVEKLVVVSSGCNLLVKREDSEGLWAALDRECSRKAIDSKKEEDTCDESESILAQWKLGGTLRQEWSKKDRDGKKEMSFLLKHWNDLHADDFRALKARFGV